MSSEEWSLTVLRLNGLKYLRPEKSWRPIVTCLVDHHPEQETILGSDGQNVNLKTPFLFQNIRVLSKLEIKVWKRSESKRKGKKRHLAATTTVSFRELLDKASVSPLGVELRLGCMDGKGKRIPKGQAQKFATIALRLRAPGSQPFASTSTASDVTIEDLEGHFSGYDTMPESYISHLSDHEIPEHEPISQLRHRRRRIKGYCLDTDESVFSITDEETPVCGEDDSTFCDDRPSESTWFEEEEEETTVVRMGPVSWFAAQILPRFHDQEVIVNVPLNAFEDMINRVSPYVELKSAVCDADFQRVLDQVRSEWRWGMNILMALSGLNATVFGFSPDIIFKVDSAAKRAIAISGVTSAIGLVLAFWYQFLYSGVSPAKFRVQARDTFDSYFFFCLCCRLPSLFMLISSVALLAFMFFVSFSVWPQAVLVVSFMTGVLVTLQYLLFGAHRLVIGIRWGFRRLGATFSRLFWRSSEGEASEKEKGNDTPGPTVDIDKNKVVESEESENEKKT